MRQFLTQNIISLWFSWYFFDVPKEILTGWRNFLLFGLNYFSIPLLLKTLFSHWRRYSWSYGRGFDIARYLNVFGSNLISRLLGAFMRTILIFFGIIAEIFIFIFWLMVFMGWFLLPILLFLGILAGLAILFF